MLQPGYVGQVNWSGPAMLTGVPYGTLCGSRLPVCSWQERNLHRLIGTVCSVHHPISLSRVRIQTSCYCHSRRQVHSCSPTSNSPIVQEIIAKLSIRGATSISQFKSKSVASATAVAVTASNSGFAAEAASEVGAAEYVVLCSLWIQRTD